MMVGYFVSTTISTYNHTYPRRRMEYFPSRQQTGHIQLDNLQPTYPISIFPMVLATT